MATRRRPGLLEWAAAVPEAVWGPVLAGVLIFIVGVIGLAAGQPWLFASLGPTAYIHSESPGHKSARFYDTLVGHLVGLGCGFAAIAILNAWNAPPLMRTEVVTLARVGAGALAVGGTLAVNTLLRITHAPAAATTLLVALGTFQTGRDAVIVVVGVVILTVLAMIARELRPRATGYRRWR